MLEMRFIKFEFWNNEGVIFRFDLFKNEVLFLLSRVGGILFLEVIEEFYLI